MTDAVEYIGDLREQDHWRHIHSIPEDPNPRVTRFHLCMVFLRYQILFCTAPPPRANVNHSGKATVLSAYKDEIADDWSQSLEAKQNTIINAANP